MLREREEKERKERLIDQDIFARYGGDIDGRDELARLSEQDRERLRYEEQAHREAYEEMMNEEDEVRRELAVENHLYRLEAEAEGEFATSDESGEDDGNESGDDEDNDDDKNSDEDSDT